MSPVAPTQRLLEATLQSLVPKLDQRDDRIVAFRASPTWSGPERVTVQRSEGPLDFRVVACPSALAVREAMVRQAADDSYLAILTDRPVEDLGEDVLARVFNRKPLSLDAWEAVKVYFQARQVDPALVEQRWMPEALLEAAPAGGYPPVPAGMLDADTAWRCVLERWGIPESAPSVETLIRWSIDAAHVERWRTAAAERRDAATKWIVARAAGAGPVAGTILRLAEKGEGRAILPVGLALGVVFDREHRDDATLKPAAIRMENVLGVTPVEPALATAWSEASSAVVAELIKVHGRKRVQSIFDAAEEVLDRVQAGRAAFVSSWLPRGLSQRLERYGERLRDALAASPPICTPALEGATSSVIEHRLAAYSETGARAVVMATRLVRWLATQRVPAEGASFQSLVEGYARDGSFVDWARADLSFDGTSPVLSDAVQALRVRVDGVRAEENTRFAAALARWLESGATTPLPIERVLDEVVVPLAGTGPVLLLVLDGMSAAVFRELIEDVTRRGWTELVAEEAHRNGPVVAAIPTVTEVSRASLLCGRLVRGDAACEKQGFAAHAGLRAVSDKNKPPVVFHKDEISRGGAGLLPEVTAVLADSDRQVVGVVVNAVDDWLLKGDQLRAPWTAGVISGLEAILSAARDGGRVVVLLSDHGHVIERGTEFRTVATEGERWRSVAEPLVDGEIRLSGPRVRAVIGSDIVAPCTERLRYGAKRNGYHGGATPQEVTVPMAVLTLSDEIPAGWRESAPWTPEWWKAPDRAVAASIPSAAASRPESTPAPRLAPGQLPLFAPSPAAAAAAEPQSVIPSAGVGVPAWVGRLLASKTFKDQLQRNARLGLDADRARRFLEALAERGGRLPLDAMARQLDLPHVRLAGLVAAMRRVLNLDGYSTLSLDDASSTVVLNADLVRSLFELEG